MSFNRFTLINIQPKGGTVKDESKIRSKMNLLKGVYLDSCLPFSKVLHSHPNTLSPPTLDRFTGDLVHRTHLGLSRTRNKSDSTIVPSNLRTPSLSGFTWFRLFPSNFHLTLGSLPYSPEIKTTSTTTEKKKGVNKFDIKKRGHQTWFKEKDEGLPTRPPILLILFLSPKSLVHFLK